MFLPQNRRPREDWGRWLQAKHNAVELAHKQAPEARRSGGVPLERHRPVPVGRAVAVSDPRHPRSARPAPAPALGPDAWPARRPRRRRASTQFDRVRVNISIPTDSEAVWRAFEPKSPPLERRWQAAAAVAGRRAGGWTVSDAAVCHWRTRVHSPTASPTSGRTC